MDGCIFCSITRGEAPASTFYADERFVGFMDIRPWRPGHALVVPRVHAVRVADLPSTQAEALFALGMRVAAALREGAPCDDVNFVLNDGPSASQTVPHVHLHVVPRTRGDAPRLLLRLLAHPLGPLVRGPSRSALDAHADALRARLG